MVSCLISKALSYETRPDSPDSISSKNTKHPYKDDIMKGAELLKAYFRNKFGGSILLNITYEENESDSKTIVFDSTYFVIWDNDAWRRYETVSCFTWKLKYSEKYNSWIVKSCGYA